MQIPGYSKQHFRKISVSAPPGGVSWIPLGDFQKSTVHKITVSTTGGQHGNASSVLEFSNGWGANSPYVHQLLTQNFNAKIDFYHYKRSNSSIGIVLEYYNQSFSQNNNLVITHVADRSVWAYPAGTYTAFTEFTDEQREAKKIVPRGGEGTGANSTISGSSNIASGNKATSQDTSSITHSPALSAIVSSS